MKIIVSAGGTGGHIYPAVAIAKEFQREYKADVLFVGTKGGMESEIAKSENLGFEWLDAGFFNSRNPIKLAGAVIRNVRGVLKAIKVVSRYKPDYVVGTGGYASAPVVFAAGIMGIKCFVQEQNVFPGKANVYLSRYCMKVFITYEESAKYFPSPKKVVLSGNPVREEFSKITREDAREKLGVEPGVMHLVIFGGSGGAQTINDMGLELIKRFNGDGRIRITLITGKRRYERFMRTVIQEDVKSKGNIDILPYSDDMPSYMKSADLVIGRSGATTISELIETGTPSILIPSPNVKDNHQEYNARLLENKGFAFVILEREVVIVDVEKRIESFINDRSRLVRMRENALALVPEKPAARFIVENIVS